MIWLKKIIRKTFLYQLKLRLDGIKRDRSRQKENALILKDWNLKGRPVPSPQVIKRRIIKEYASRYKIKSFIESGTYMGDTVEDCKRIFKKIASIELDPSLYQGAKKRFENDNHITIYKGDSGEIIGLIMKEVSEPCLFWLDGHYSEGITAKGNLNTPILDELTHILHHRIKTHVILIDDARCFNGLDDYPSIDTLREIVKKVDNNLRFEIADDIIRISE